MKIFRFFFIAFSVIGVVQLLIVLGFTLKMEPGGASGIPLALSLYPVLPACLITGAVLGVVLEILIGLSRRGKSF